MYFRFFRNAIDEEPVLKESVGETVDSQTLGDLDVGDRVEVY